MQREVVTLATPAALAEEAARRFVALAQSSIAARGEFRVALSGGSTPKALYEVLSGTDFRDNVDWEHVQIFFSDERFVPPDSTESNFHTAREGLLRVVPIPERFVHPVATVDISPQESALLYAQGIRRVFGPEAGEIPRFDLIFLGLGPDGHTASLFPGTDALQVIDTLVAANFVPKFESWRITFTYPLLNAGAVVMFLVQGQDKAARVADVLSNTGDLPAAGVNPRTGHLVWLLDAAAASSLDQSGR